MYVDTDTRSNAAIAGSDTADGVAGFAAKSLPTLTDSVATAKRACDMLNTPLSSVVLAHVVRLATPGDSTDTSSYSELLPSTSPSTSKKVRYERSNGGICVVVPDCTNVKSNSPAFSVVGVPSTQLAVVASSAAPDAHDDGSMPKPRHTYPSDVETACDTALDCGLE